MRRTCAAVRSCFSRFSASASASTSAGVRGAGCRGDGTSASNPPACVLMVDGWTHNPPATAIPGGVRHDGDAGVRRACCGRDEVPLARLPGIGTRCAASAAGGYGSRSRVLCARDVRAGGACGVNA
jgi:hypothetical protein